jgi:hypothetical protein
MLTGRRLFDGETISHTLAEVLRRPIDLGELPKDTPPSVRNLITRCLERDVKRRLRDIGEARIVLEGPVTRSGEAAPGSHSRVLPWTYVERTAPLSSDSRGSRAAFSRGVSGLKEFSRSLVRTSGVHCHYVGEWHTHPGGAVYPSNQDDDSQSGHREGFNYALSGGGAYHHRRSNPH